MIQFTENGILQELGSIQKNWTIPELLEANEPLPGEPLAVRNEALKRILPLAEELYSELSEVALLRYDFWKQLLPKRIAEQTFTYTTRATSTGHWELTINREGLFYKDISPESSQMPGTVQAQLFSDFWFSGPLMPMPDLQIQKQVVANIRNAFVQAGSPASYRHFELFEYPTGDGQDGQKRQEIAGAPETAHNEASKRLFMENGGQVHYIHRDGLGDVYKATAAEEAAWRAELIEKYTERLSEEDNETVLASLAQTLEYNGVKNVSELLYEAAKKATPRVQQAIARLLTQQRHGKGASYLDDRVGR